MLKESVKQLLYIVVYCKCDHYTDDSLVLAHSGLPQSVIWQWRKPVPPILSTRLPVISFIVPVCAITLKNHLLGTHLLIYFVLRIVDVH